MRHRAEQWLGVPPEAKPKIYVQLYEASEFLSLNYALELLLSAGIATLGLVLNSPAVVIGAMLISPLMGPILATGLALAASDVYLGIKCLINLVMSVLAAVLFSALLVWLLPFHSPTGEILARVRPNLLDLGVALFSGLAGSLVLCRGGGGGGVTALPGVAIAVALMPPLCTVGFGVGSGMDWAVISGAGLLFLTNLAAIVACAFLVFTLVRMDSPDVRMSIGYSELERASRDWLYGLLQRTRLGQSLGDLGQLRWRVLMLLITLAVLFFPLRQSLVQLRDETVSRSAVREALRALAPADAILSQQLDISPNGVTVRLAVASAIPAEQVRRAERQIVRRTGKEATLMVRQVASQDEIALLRDRLRPPPPPPPPPQDLESMRAELLGRVEKPLRAAWPEETAPLAGYEVGLSQEGVLVRVRYQSRRPLDASVQEVLGKVLGSSLQTKSLRVELQREPPPTRAIRR